MTNPTKPQHTPTPWIAETRFIYSKQGAFYLAQTMKNDMGFSFTKGESEAIANAAHIVKCVNLHDDVFALIEKLLDERPNDLTDDYEQAFKDLLNRAKGQE